MNKQGSRGRNCESVKPGPVNLCNRSLDRRDFGSPGAIAAAAKSDALALDVRWASVAQFDRRLRERDIVEMPAPSAIDFRACDDSANGDSGSTASLHQSRRLDLIVARQHDSERFVDHSKRHDDALRRRGGNLLMTRGTQRPENDGNRISDHPHCCSLYEGHFWQRSFCLAETSTPGRARTRAFVPGQKSPLTRAIADGSVGAPARKPREIDGPLRATARPSGPRRQSASHREQQYGESTARTVRVGTAFPNSRSVSKA